jgi:hypothetical protein
LGHGPHVSHNAGALLALGLASFALLHNRVFTRLTVQRHDLPHRPIHFVG